MNIEDVVGALADESAALKSLWDSADLDEVPFHYVLLGQQSVNHLHTALSAVVEYLAERDGYDGPGPDATVLDFPAGR